MTDSSRPDIEQVIQYHNRELSAQQLDEIEQRIATDTEWQQLSSDWKAFQEALAHPAPDCSDMDAGWERFKRYWKVRV
jgi:hypothetical protein